jgi:DNA-binding transcriptional regulator YiaG
MTAFTMITIERNLDGRTFKGQVRAEVHPKHGPVFEPGILTNFDRQVAQLAACQGAHGPQSMRFLRKVAELSMEETARLLRVKRSTVHRWEKGPSDIPGGVMETMRALALDATRDEHATRDRLNAALEEHPLVVEVPPLEEAC